MRKHWIVLVNRSPRGPLTFEEISTLLGEKVLKRTDLAIQLNENTEEEKSAWKFLWQYPEFDSRLSSQSSQSSSAQAERRASPSAEKIQSQVASLLPEELAQIQPEDLIILGKRTQKKPLQSFFSAVGNDGVDELPYTSEKSSNSGSKWGYVFVASVLVLGGFLIKSTIQQLGTLSSPVTIEKDESRGPATMGLPPLAPKNTVKSNLNPTPMNTPGNAPVRGVVETTPTPKRNEITLEEYERLKAEQNERTRLEDEDRRREEEEAEKLADRNVEEDSLENIDSEASNDDIERPLKRAKNKKSSRARSQMKKQIGEESEEDSGRTVSGENQDPISEESE